MATTTKAKPAKKTAAAAGADTITKEMPIGKIVMEHPETIDVFMKNGLHCIGCAAAHFENLQQGCEAHGIDAAKMVKELNAAVKAKRK